MKRILLLSVFFLIWSSSALSVTWYTNPSNGHHYTVYSELRSWEQSEAIALSLDGHLVTINDQEENDWIIEYLLPKFNHTGTLWIGLFNENGIFKWINGEPLTYTNWYPSQPNPSLDYAVIDTKTNREPGRWLSVLPDNKHSIIEVSLGEIPTRIEDAHTNIGYNVNYFNDQENTSYSFGLSIDAFGEFSEMQTNDITLTANGTSLDLNFLNVSLRNIVNIPSSFSAVKISLATAISISDNPKDASKYVENVNIPILIGDRLIKTSQVTEPNFYTIKAGGSFQSNPILGEYVVEVRDNRDLTASHSIGTLMDYPQDAPVLTYPSQSQIITEQTPTFSWESFNFTYIGNSLGVSNYCLDLGLPNGELYSLWEIPGDHTSEEYYAHVWWNHNQEILQFLPSIRTGNYSLNLGAFQNIDSGFNFSANQQIEFFADIPEDVNADSYINILDLVLISIHFGRQVDDGLLPSWTSIGDGSIPDRADVNNDGIVNILDMVRVSIAFSLVLEPELQVIDTYIDVNNPFTTHGSDSPLIVHADGPANNWIHERSLIQFDLSNYHTVTASRVELKIRLDQILHPGEVKLYGLLEEWNDEWASWNTRKEGIDWGTSGGVFDNEDKITEIHSGTADENGWMSFDITQLFNEWVTGIKENYGLILTPGSMDVYLLFDSMESSNSPYLKVTY